MNCLKVIWEPFSNRCRLLSVSVQVVVKELFSQFGEVQSVELRDHPGSSQESGPKLSKFFKPAEKQVGTRSCFFFLPVSLFMCDMFANRLHLLSVSLRVSKSATLCSKNPPVYQQLNPTRMTFLWWSARSSVQWKQEYRVSAYVCFLCLTFLNVSVTSLTHPCYVLSLPEWIQQYTESFIQPEKLQQIVDSFMEDYDKRKRQVRVEAFLKFVFESKNVFGQWLCTVYGLNMWFRRPSSLSISAQGGLFPSAVLTVAALITKIRR